MSALPGPTDRDLDRLAGLATTLAAAWAARARASTSVGQERAVLRLFGVQGLDAAGRPLAAEVVDRWVGREPQRLANGIALPFAMALLEYDLAPQRLALDVASGAVDLGLEAALLREDDRRAVAEGEASRLAEVALARIDANRTARLELRDVLGDPAPPWIATTLGAGIVRDAAVEARARVTEGIDVLRVEVPVGRELVERLTDAGLEAPARPSSGQASYDDPSSDDHSAPTGSQRGLAHLRRELDEVAARRRGYVRIATVAPALASPEQSVVAAFERIDLVEADPLTEVVAGRVDPDRAIADHAFAHRLLRRSGAIVLLGPGPLVVAPDLATGVPSDPATRAGRALALQLVSAALASEAGLGSEQVVVGALPPWLVDEPEPAARAAAEVSLRRRLMPDHPFAFEEPPTTPERAAAWPFILAAALAASPRAALVLRRAGVGSMAAATLSTRGASSVARELASAFDDRPLAGAAASHAAATVAAAVQTLEAVEKSGWRAVLGEAPGGGDRPLLGGDAVVERVEAFDPFGSFAASSGDPRR